MKPSSSGITACAVCMTLAAGASAQGLSKDLGAFEFMNSCAVCHGASGAGDGPMADQLTVPPADLTQLQSGNGGIFPVARIYHSIMGEDRIGAHGTQEMPAWGKRFSDRVTGDAPGSDAAGETYARTRILSLIDHISTLQK